MGIVVFGSVEFESGMLVLRFVGGYQNDCDFVKPGGIIHHSGSKQKEE